MSKEKDDQQLQIKQPTALAVNDFAGLPTGYENVTSADMAMPFLRIGQTQMKQTNKDAQGYVQGLEPGMFFNSVNGRVYGKSATLVFLWFTPEIIHWGQELGDFKGTVSREMFDKEIKPLCKLNEKMEYVDPDGSKYKECKTFYVLNADHPSDDVMKFVLAGKGVAQSRKILSTLRMQTIGEGKDKKEAPMFAFEWKVDTMLIQDKQYSWYGIGDSKTTNIKPLGIVRPEIRGKVVEMVKTLADYHSQKDDVAPF